MKSEAFCEGNGENGKCFCFAVMREVPCEEGVGANCECLSTYEEPFD